MSSGRNERWVSRVADNRPTSDSHDKKDGKRMNHDLGTAAVGLTALWRRRKTVRGGLPVEEDPCLAPSQALRLPTPIPPPPHPKIGPGNPCALRGQLFQENLLPFCSFPLSTAREPLRPRGSTLYDAQFFAVQCPDRDSETGGPARSSRQ